MKPSIAAVHPELQNIARMMPNLPLTKKSLGAFRTLIKLFVRGAKMPAGIEARNQILPGRDGNSRIRLRIYQAQDRAAKNPALLWIHGGGYIIGSPEMDDRYMLPFIQELGAVVVSVDYRLAPEFPFPAALDDCWSVLLWLVEQADSLGIDPSRIAIGGESAGGGLAAALAQMAHDRG
jgi:acetyl esterase/lipase